MATQDLSRHLFQPSKRYASARMQQGRVLVDSDVNEAEMLGAEDRRAVLSDAVGPHGSSTAGFQIGAVSPTSYDFQIVSGSYILDGLRHEIAGDSAGPQMFRKQSDWRQSSRSGVTLPTLPVAAQHDLVYLVGWEQTVSAVEDLELVEHALGGRDTSVRVRRMHRVYVLQSTAADCTEAFDDGLVGALTTGGHTFDPANPELKSAARLQVTLAAVVASDELCNPPGLVGYSGTENQAIRIEMIAANRFLWAFDNASPLYRVLATREENTVTLEFLTPPQEQAQFPLAGQVLELLPWGARLANGEHTADFPIGKDIGGGLYARALVTYDHSTRKMTASISDPALFDAMQSWFATESVPVAQRFLFLRVWSPDGAPGTGYGLGTGASQVLPGTGLSVVVTGSGIVGDHWIFAARPATPGKLVPWDVATAGGVPPHGPRRFYCPLGMLHWTVALPLRTVQVGSCRRPFRPLTRLRGCCSVTVGDGTTSFGDYTSIQAAVDALPDDAPGKVCVLPGVYAERIVIGDRSRLVIEGCGSRTLIRTPANNETSQGLITITDSVDVTLRDFRVEATGQFGVTVRPDSRKISLEKLLVTTRRDDTLPRPSLAGLVVTAGSAAFPLCTFDAQGASDVRLLACTFTEVGDLSTCANVRFTACQGVLVRSCKISTPPGAAVISRAWGGLQIAGGCSDVLVERCRIEGGLGHGVTLGSMKVDATTDASDPGNDRVMAPTTDCPAVGGGFGVLDTFTGTASPPLPVPDDGPHDVRIRRNRIHGMGGSGISVLGFWPEVPRRGDEVVLEQIQTHDLVIDDNVIEGNCTHPPDSSLPPAIRQLAAFGGITLADADRLRIHDNLIRSNGADHRHPVCGIYVLHGESIAVENNQIEDNGRRVPGTGLAGHRAGIALQFVGRGLADAGDVDRSRPAARVRGNTVLQPAGRALQIYGSGPMFIEGNVLVSQGLDGISASERQFAAHCIEILNTGQAIEIDPRAAVGFVATFAAPELPSSETTASAYRALLDGRVLFTDNIVRFEPASGAAENLFCVNRVQSYGDVGVLNNQFLARLPAGEGRIDQDTIVIAWSTRTSHNRWEDPARQIGTTGTYQTTTSAATLARMNITDHNQASRCIHADVSTVAADPPANPRAGENQVFRSAGCTVVPQIAGLLTEP